ncbi:N-acetyltransferase family protein [Pseudomonas sp.]|uniref:GNAT family N-acetyltransferase n=1 Tax=Pseudomonas sp. TaxID=306 RepID=UPI003C72146C
MSIEIRPVTHADHAAWLPLWQGYLDFYQSELPAAVSAMTWQRFLDPSEPTHAALAWHDGQALGLVQWIFHRSNWLVEHSCYLQDLFVSPGLRGTGVGRLLIEHVYAQAREAGAAKVHWLTHESNSTAMQLYDRIAERPGFVQYRKTF